MVVCLGSSQGVESRPVQPAVKPETISIHSASTRPHSDPHAGGAFNELLRHDESRVEQTNKLRPGWDASGRNGGSWGRGGALTAHLHGRFLLADARTKEILEKAAVLSGVLHARGASLGPNSLRRGCRGCIRVRQCQRGGWERPQGGASAPFFTNPMHESKKLVVNYVPVKRSFPIALCLQSVR